MVLKATHRAKTRRGKLHLESREPKHIENPRSAIILKGHSSSEIVNRALRDLYMLKKPFAKIQSRKNHDCLPFEKDGGEVGLERMAKKFDSSLFIVGNHTKKRPHNLILGRMFDFHILDMMEFGITSFKGIDEFKGATCASGSKPCLLFNGDGFDEDTEDNEKFKNIMIDFFRGEQISSINLAGLDHVLVFTLTVKGIIHLRHYQIVLKKSKDVNDTLPRVELAEIGPALDLVRRRSQYASVDMMRAALKKAKKGAGGGEAAKKKNIEFDEALGDKLGKVHVDKQNLDDLALAKMKALKKRKRNRDDSDVEKLDDGPEDDNDDQRGVDDGDSGDPANDNDSEEDNVNDSE